MCCTLLHGQNDLQIALSNVNTYLAAFDNGYYGYIEIKDGYLINHFKSNDFTKTKIDDLAGAYLIDDNTSVALMCRNNAECVFSTYNNSYNTYAQYRTTGEWDKTELQMLLSNLLETNYSSGSNKTNYNTTNTAIGSSTLNYNDGAVYVGDVLEQKKHGKGKYIAADGSIVEGDWVNDLFEGYGTLIKPNGEIIEGSWKNNNQAGKSTVTNPMLQTVQEQNWENNQLQGKMKIYFNDPENAYLILEKTYNKGVASPDVVLTYRNGEVYAGGYSQDAFMGYGIYTYVNGTSEKGNFTPKGKTGQFDFTPKGEPTQTYYYENDTLAGVFDGQKLKFDNGDVYDGPWKNGLQHGAGKLRTQKETIMGIWQNGFLDGEVTVISNFDEQRSTYIYRAGTIVSESFSAAKFERQLIQLLEDHKAQFMPIMGSKEENTYQVNTSLNSFTSCEVKNYPPGISSSGKNEFVFIAKSPAMDRAAANQLCKDIEGVLLSPTFKPRLLKAVEYDVATRLLVNYYTEDQYIVINLDTFGGEDRCSVEIRIR